MPRDVVERFAAVRQDMDICPNHATQAVLVAFIREGHFARHLRRMRRVYDERRRVLVDEIKRQFGSSCEIVGSATGMHLTLLLGDKVRDREIAERALDKKLLPSASALSH